MFGILRTTLALMVMVYHLFIGWLPLGTYAVFSFYTISGYLMTLVMHQSYGYNSTGKLSFALNRILRLYPQYWAAVFFSLSLIMVLGQDIVTNYHKSIAIPTTFKETLQNALIAFTAWSPNTINPRLVPPTWAITIEIFFYLMIGLGISKTFFRVKVWLFLSMSYVVGSYIIGWSWQTRYFPIPSASLPFAIGAATYFLTKNKNLSRYFHRSKLSSWRIFIFLLLNCLIGMFAYKLGFDEIMDIGFYLNILISGLLIFSLATGGRIFSISRKLDQLIGNYSYPIYLLHWQCGLLTSYLLFGDPIKGLNPKGFIALIASLVVIVLISSLFIFLIDRPIQKIRLKVKG